jgi:hypothetical protein
LPPAFDGRKRSAVGTFKLSDGQDYEMVDHVAHAEPRVVVYEVRRREQAGPVEVITFEWQESTDTVSQGTAAPGTPPTIVQEARERVLRHVMGLGKTRRAIE